MPMEHLGGRKHLVKRWLAILGNTIAIMQFLWAINAQPDEKAVLLQEEAPLVI